MKVLILLALVALATAFDFPEEWEAWKKEHCKVYKEELEELRRHTIWQANKKFINAHNSVADKFGYTLGMNHLGDLENHEIVAIFNGFLMKERSNTSKTFVADPTRKLNATVDWRQKGYVTKVKFQGNVCGSCWAFSATGSLEGQHFKKTGTLVSLSEQNLVDCSTNYNNNGCQGGTMDNAFRYIKANGGIDTESSYPYQAHNEVCRFNKDNIGATDTGFMDVQRKSESSLTQAIMTVGPISVAIDASRSSFHFYKSGIYYEPACNSTNLDHGVLAVGYGTDSGKDYYIVKNSWNAQWGMDGYILMSRNRNNNCGIATQASYPLV